MLFTQLFEGSNVCPKCGQTPCNCTGVAEEKVRLDPKCWTGKKIGNPKTKVKGGVRVNNCVPAESVEEGMLDGPGQEDSPVAQAIVRRILLQRTDLLAKYGPEKVGAAVDEVADFVGDVEEIGSSDVSGWVRHVEQMLGNMEQGVAEGSPQSMGTALTNALSKVEPGSKLDKKIRHHNDMVRRFGPEAGTMTSAPDGYRIDKKGFIRLGQGVAESLADEFMAMAKAKGMNPRLRGTPDEERARTDAMLKQRAADRANAPAPAPAAIGADERARLEAQLKDLEAKFDPSYDYSDDHSYWTQQRGISQQIGAIKQRLKQGMAEGNYDRDDYYNARQGREYGKGLTATGYGGDNSGTRRDDIFKGQSKHLPADPFARTSGAVPKTGTGRIHSTALPGEMDEGEKIGNMDADRFDDAVARLKKLAGAGPLKTVWDPAKRVYKNVPIAVQPAQQPKK